MTKINKTHKLKEYSMLIMDSVKKWSTPFYLVNNLLFGPLWKEKKGFATCFATSLFQTLSSALSLTPRHDVQSVIDYADKTMTTQSPTVNFGGLSLTVKKRASEIKYLVAHSYPITKILTFENIRISITQAHRFRALRSNISAKKKIFGKWVSGTHEYELYDQ